MTGQLALLGEEAPTSPSIAFANAMVPGPSGIDLTVYGWIVIASSGGKDSQAQLHAVYQLARLQGVEDRIVVVHCDLGRVEWAGTAELAEEQARHYGVRFEKVSRPQGDLLTHVEQRGMWPSSAARYCTSDHKRSQAYKVMTRLTGEAMVRPGWPMLEPEGPHASPKPAPVRILNCLGIRAQESTARAKKIPFQRDAMASNGRRLVDTWFPIFTWTEAEVWSCIRASGVPHHKAYDLGMPRLSCCFCVLASRDALLVAGHHNPVLLAEYVAVEARIGHDFQAPTKKRRLPIADIQRAIQAGERPTGKITGWCM